MKTLAERLIAAREAKGWKKADLRRAAKIKSPSTLTEIESGGRTESPQLPVIAEALGGEGLWLQHGRGPEHKGADKKGITLPNQQNPIITRIVKMLESTDDVGRGVALQAITTALENYRPTRKHRAN